MRVSRSESGAYKDSGNDFFNGKCSAVIVKVELIWVLFTKKIKQKKYKTVKKRKTKKRTIINTLEALYRIR